MTTDFILFFLKQLSNVIIASELNGVRIRSVTCHYCMHLSVICSNAQLAGSGWSE